MSEQQPSYQQIQDGEEVTPQMDGYLMKCCDCGLVHRARFRAIEVTGHRDDGTFTYEELDPEKYRVQLSLTRMELGGKDDGRRKYELLLWAVASGKDLLKGSGDMTVEEVAARLDAELTAASRVCASIPPARQWLGKWVQALSGRIEDQRIP